MKNIITLFSFILIITSCDVVEGPYEIDTGDVTPTDTNTYVKKILIEDFTGHTCSNCPTAARELEAIRESYGDQIIGMALHVSSFAAPHTGSGKFEYDFRTQWGNSWSNFFEISALPSGMVNRIGYPNEHKLGKDEWSDAAITELEKEIDFGISIISDINGDNGTITINTELLNDVNGDYKLVVCLTESNIINWQKDIEADPEDIEFYEHNHTLRTILLDESFSPSSTYTAGEIIETPITINLSSLEQSNIEYSTTQGGGGNCSLYLQYNYKRNRAS
jgi:hypothetical protein